MVELIKIRYFPTFGSQLPHQHSFVVENEMKKKFHRTIAPEFLLAGFAPKQKSLTWSASSRDSARSVTSILSRGTGLLNLKMPVTPTMQSMRWTMKMILTLCCGWITVEHAKGTPRSIKFYNDRGIDRYEGRVDGYGGGRGDYGSDDRSSLNYSNRSKYSLALKTKYGLIVENMSSRTGWQNLKDLSALLLKWRTLKPTRTSEEKEALSSTLNKI